jgi:hypothetical protein
MYFSRQIRIRRAVSIFLISLTTACVGGGKSGESVSLTATKGVLEAAEVRDRLKDSISRTESVNALEIVGIEDGDIGRVVSTILVDNELRAATVVEQRGVGGDPALTMTTEQTLIDGAASVRTSVSNEPVAPFTEVPMSTAEYDLWLSRLTTLNGRLYPSLGVIADLVSNAPFAVDDLGKHDIDGVGASGMRLSFAPNEIATILTTNWQADIDEVPDAYASQPVSVFEFWIDDDGFVRRIIASGTHFEDGEALTGVLAQMTLTRLEIAPQIIAPSGTPPVADVTT